MSLDVSLSNSNKLDVLLEGQRHVVQVLEGSGVDSPGLLHKVRTHETILSGDVETGSLGIVQKVGIMWRVHVWLLCGFSGAIGGAIGYLVRGILKI